MLDSVFACRAGISSLQFRSRLSIKNREKKQQPKVLMEVQL